MRHHVWAEAGQIASHWVKWGVGASPERADFESEYPLNTNLTTAMCGRADVLPAVMSFSVVGSNHGPSLSSLRP